MKSAFLALALFITACEAPKSSEPAVAITHTMSPAAVGEFCGNKMIGEAVMAEGNMTDAEMDASIADCYLKCSIFEEPQEEAFCIYTTKYVLAAYLEKFN